MDRGSYRGAQPERRVINGSESSGASRAPEPVAAPSTSSYSSNDEPPRSSAYRGGPSSYSRSTPDKKGPKWWLWVLIAVIAVAVIGAVAWFMFSGKKAGDTAIDSSKYQAVLLTNGESYFGKLTNLNDDSMRLTDVYYLKAKSGTAANDTAGTQDTDEGDFQLIKLGGEVQGPEDEIIIMKSQLLYYENLRPDGKASQAISQYKKSQ